MRYLLLSIALAALAGTGCVQEVSPAIGCSGDDDCAGGETCVDGFCRLADDPLVRACTASEEAAHCGVGSYCANGACAELPSCAGGAICPSGLVCNEATGGCIRAPDCEDCCTAASCDDGRWCNGVEVCDSGSGECLPGEPPCGGGPCDESTRSCLCTDDSDCVPPETCDDGICGCTPDCAGKQCGDDGCGGSCGTCADEDECDDGVCQCIPDCTGRHCGDDGCDGSCGACADGFSCVDGACQCIPDCTGKQCGSDGCGGSCGTCPGGETCAPNGQCNCVPSCTGRECGDDGCGGSCGTCATGSCGADGQCNCTPSCAGRECGSDGCGGSCGSCGPHQVCSGASGQCLNTGVVCDVFTDVITQNEYQSRSGALTGSIDEQYQWDNRPHRYLDNYPLTAPQGTSVNIELTSNDFDTVLYVYNVAGGSCVRVAKDDDSGGNLNSALSFTVGSGDYHIVATSWQELKTGSYRLSTSTELCGLPVSQTVYNRCRDRVLVGSNPPCSKNPCLDYGNSKEFCCVTENCRNGYGIGNELLIVEDDFCLNP